MLELNLDFGSTDLALEKLKNRLSRDQIRQKNAQKESRQMKLFFSDIVYITQTFSYESYES